MIESKEEKQIIVVEDIVANYPDLFNKDKEGFTRNIFLPKGWVKLVDNLCSLISWHVKYAKEPKPTPKVVQIKEKFGGLRFYCDGTNETINAFITFAECMSCELCQDCGTNQNVSKKTNNYWLNIRCDECRNLEEVTRVKKEQ